MVVCALAHQPDGLAQTGLWLCPGNRFTNQIDEPEARAQACVRAEPGRLSRGHGHQQNQGVVDSAPSPVSSAQSVGADVAPPGGGRSPPGSREAVVRPSGVQQQRRDEDARAILEAELERTRAQIKSLTSHPEDSQSAAAVHRLRGDEAALQRELARLAR